MKKALFLSMIMAFMSFSSLHISASSLPVTLQAGYNDPTEDQGKPHKAPVLVPEVSIDGYTLYLTTPGSGYTLTLIDENGELAYETVVPSGTTTLTLPSWLSGEYEIRLQPSGSSIYFYGWIEL